MFSNSYLVVLGPDYETAYVKYSNDRAPQFRICTEIVGRQIQEPFGTNTNGVERHEAGLSATETRGADISAGNMRMKNYADATTGRVVRKRPLCEEAFEHVRNMAAAGESLAERYAEGELAVNACRLLEGTVDCLKKTGSVDELTETKQNAWPAAEFEFVSGTPLSELMDDALTRKEEKEFQRLFQEYLRRIDHNSAMPVADYDLVFSNILVDGDKWTLIDYEWTFGKEMETKELAFRAVYCYLLENEKREELLPLDWILEQIHVSPEEADIYRQQEHDFQKYVTGQRLSMPQMRELLGKKVIKPWKMLESFQDAEQICRVQVYEDRGSGYKEEESYFVKEAYQTESQVELTLTVSGDVNTIRIDPIMDSCVVKIQEMTFNGERIPLEKKKLLLVNGRSSGGELPSIVFATKDPNLGIDLSQLERKAENMLCAILEVTRIPLSTAEDLCKALAKHIRL